MPQAAGAVESQSFRRVAERKGGAPRLLDINAGPGEGGIVAR